jgi:hypothetical protein
MITNAVDGSIPIAGKSESPSFGEVDDGNNGNDDYVYDERREQSRIRRKRVQQHLSTENNLSKSIGVCLYPRVDNDIVEQGVEELLDSNAETIDPKKDWIKKWQ